MRNVVKLKGRYYEERQIDLDDLTVETDSEVQLYRTILLEAQRGYTTDPDDDVLNEYQGDSISTLLEIVKQQNRRIIALESLMEAARPTPHTVQKEEHDA